MQTQNIIQFSRNKRDFLPTYIRNICRLKFVVNGERLKFFYKHYMHVCTVRKSTALPNQINNTFLLPLVLSVNV